MPQEGKVRVPTLREKHFCPIFIPNQKRQCFVEGLQESIVAP